MEEKRRKLNSICEVIFIVVFAIFLASVLVKIVVFGQKSDFKTEYRKANVLPALSLHDVLNGSFQSNLESALADQIPGAENFKTLVFQQQNKSFNSLSWLSINPSTKYRLVGKGLYSYDNSDYLLWEKQPESFFSEASNEVKKTADFYNQLPIKNKFLYIVTTDRGIDFDHPDNDKAEKIAAQFSDFEFDKLKIPDFETYKKYYMKNDHHWNYEGSYQGYKDIVRLMLGENEAIKTPAEKAIFNYLAVGSKSRVGHFYDYEEKFTAYRFDLGSHKTFIDGVENEYGNQNKYFNDMDLRNGSGTITYGDFYGDDYAKIEFDFNQPTKQNLLIVGNSDTNSINLLLASHFNKTIVVDPRHIRMDDFMQIVNSGEIQNILVMPNIWSINGKDMRISE